MNMTQTTIWDFLPQESSIEAEPTNQRNIMTFKSLDELAEFFKGLQSKSDSAGTEPFTSDKANELDHDPEDCLDCQLAYLSQREALLLANVNVAILDVMHNTLNQEAAIRNEQADTLVKLAQVRTLLLDAN